MDKEYGQPEECLYRSEQAGLGGAYIIRLPCGKPKEYIRLAAILAKIDTSLHIGEYYPVNVEGMTS